MSAAVADSFWLFTRLALHSLHANGGRLLTTILLANEAFIGLQMNWSKGIVPCIGMKAKGNGHRHRVELGRHIVADSKICGGQPTFKGTRIMVWIILEQLEDGMTWDEVLREWGGKVSKQGIAEAIAISDLVVKHEPFRGFNVDAQ